MKKIFLLLVFLVNFSIQSDACSGPPTGFRFWMFMPLIHEAKGIPHSYDLVGYAHSTAFRHVYLDTAHYHVNVDEWSKQLGEKAQRADIFNILYHTEPSEYWYNDNQRVAHNSFIKTLQSADYQEEKVYLDFAKACESAYGENDIWSESDDSKIEIEALKRLLAQGENMLQMAKKPFVQLRIAYLSVKLCSYLNENEKLKGIYKKYIEKSPMKSWVKASAAAYAGEKLTAFAYSYDKRNIGFWETKSELLKMAKDRHERATVYVLQRNSGRNLSVFEKIYQIEANNKDLPLLIANEITKLEDWLLTYELTDFQKFYHEDWFEEEYQPHGRCKFNQIAFDADVKYLAQFRFFIDKILKEKKAKNLDLIRLEAAHLAFLAKDYKSAKKHLNLLKTSQSKDNQIFIQKNILQYVVKIKSAKKITPEIEETTRQLFEYIDKNAKWIASAPECRSQITLLIAKDFLNKNNIAKGTLLLCQTYQNYGEECYGWKNAYHYLFDFAKPNDYENLIKLARKTPEKRSRFEQFLFDHIINYECMQHRYSEEYEAVYGKTFRDPVWEDNVPISNFKCKKIDTCRLLDYKGMYYLNHDDLQNTYAAWSRIPNEYWERSPYKDYIRNPLKGNRHSKTDYIKSMIDLQQSLDTAKVTKGYIYAQLGGAYFGMSYHGKSWLMRDIYRPYYRKNHVIEGHVNPNEYFGTEKALFYYQKAFNLAKNKEMSAYLGGFINLCLEKKDELQYVLKHGRPSDNYVYKGFRMDSNWAKQWHLPKNEFDDYFRHNCEVEVNFDLWNYK